VCLTCAAYRQCAFLPGTLLPSREKMGESISAPHIVWHPQLCGRDRQRGDAGPAESKGPAAEMDVEEAAQTNGSRSVPFTEPRPTSKSALQRLAR